VITLCLDLCLPRALYTAENVIAKGGRLSLLLFLPHSHLAVDMAAHANLAALDDLPPPAYCEQEREYDRKTATAIELSRQEQERQEEEEWEEWDEAKFEEAAKVRTSREPTAASGSRPVSSSVRALPALPGVQTQPSNTPSRLTTPQRQQTPRADEKKSIKSKPAVPQSTKPRPSWYEEAGLGDSNSVSSASSSAGVSYSGSSSTSSSSANVRPTHHLMVHNFTSLDEQDDDDDSVLPPFAPTDPSLNTLGGIPVGDVITLSYNGRSNPNHFSRLGPPPGTPPPSSYFSLSSSVSEPPLPASTPILSPPPPSRPVLQVEPIPRPRSTSTVRTTSTYNPGPPVRMGFDPSVAYAKNEILSKVVEKQQPSPASPVNPLSLYK